MAMAFSWPRMGLKVEQVTLPKVLSLTTNMLSMLNSTSASSVWVSEDAGRFSPLESLHCTWGFGYHPEALHTTHTDIFCTFDVHSRDRAHPCRRTGVRTLEDTLYSETQDHLCVSLESLMGNTGIEEESPPRLGPGFVPIAQQQKDNSVHCYGEQGRSTLLSTTKPRGN